MKAKKLSGKWIGIIVAVLALLALAAFFAPAFQKIRKFLPLHSDL